MDQAGIPLLGKDGRASDRAMLAAPADASSREDRIGDPDRLDPIRAALVMLASALLGWLATATLVWFAVRLF
jgi:hypothetical protein